MWLLVSLGSANFIFFAQPPSHFSDPVLNLKIVRRA